MSWFRDALFVRDTGVRRSAAAGIHVLFVNGWRRRRKRLAWMMERLGFEVEFGALDAGEMVASAPRPDVVVLAYGDGSPECTTFITNYREGSWYRSIPMIALSETRDEQDVERCIDLGCDDALNFGVLTAQLLQARIKKWAAYGKRREEERRQFSEAVRDKRRAEAFSQIIIPLGVAMMAEKDFDVLLYMILTEAKQFCNADGGTLYLKTKPDRLAFMLVQNDSLNLAFGGPGAPRVPFEPLPLPVGGPLLEGNARNVATHVALTGETINLEDAYTTERFDFSGTRAFDQKTGYRTQSVLAIPLKNKPGDVVGVLQLLNAKDPETGAVIAFDNVLQTITESLSLLAAQALESYQRMSALQARVESLSIEIDEAKKKKQVEEITASDHFRQLKEKARVMRASIHDPNV